MHTDLDSQVLVLDMPAEREPLSKREIDVLRLLVMGFSNLEIAEQLVITESTVKMHLKHLYGKLGVHNRVQAVVQAQASHLLA